MIGEAVDMAFWFIVGFLFVAWFVREVRRA